MNSGITVVEACRTTESRGSTVFIAQYLESYDPQQHTPGRVRQRLREAFSRLPLSIVCTGWAIPPVIIDACAQECSQAGAALYRWHPLLAGDGVFVPRAEWQTFGAGGQEVVGFRRLPEFTFVCPNHPSVPEAVLEHLERSLRGGPYQGVFLDRIRFPSPAGDPANELACFCPACVDRAAREGVDLPALGAEILHLSATENGRLELVAQLFQLGGALEAFFAFRQRSIQRLIQAAAGVASQAGCAVGLDTFSPALTRMVGQVLAELSKLCEWVKPMSYAHALGPSGLPFELSALAKWLASQGAQEQDALRWLAQASGIALPASMDTLQEQGVSPSTLERETRLARQQCTGRLYPGIALVELPGVNHLAPGQMAEEVRAYRDGGADGMVLAWDLWLIPLERLDQVGKAWEDQGAPNPPAIVSPWL